MSFNAVGASSNDPVGLATGNLTLGWVIDGYMRLSDADKRIFQLAAGLAPVGANAPIIGATANAVPAQPAVPTGTVDAANAASTRNIVAPGVPLPEGHTRDPKTGKVYKLVKPKDKSQERIALENNLAIAKKDLSRVIRDNSIRIKDVVHDGGRIEKVLDCELDESLNTRYGYLRGIVNSRKQELENYKNSHPEQFAPPPVRRNRNRRQGSNAQTGSA